MTVKKREAIEFFGAFVFKDQVQAISAIRKVTERKQIKRTVWIDWLYQKEVKVTEYYFTVYLTCGQRTLVSENYKTEEACARARLGFLKAIDAKVFMRRGI